MARIRQLILESRRAEAEEPQEDRAEIRQHLLAAKLAAKSEDDRSLARMVGGSFIVGIVIWASVGYALWRLL